MLSLIHIYIGYNDQQITVGNSNNYTIILKEDTESLDEVVVVGYGLSLIHIL